jgi:hypothetical protein
VRRYEGHDTHEILHQRGDLISVRILEITGQYIDVISVDNLRSGCIKVDSKIELFPLECHPHLQTGLELNVEVIAEDPMTHKLTLKLTPEMIEQLVKNQRLHPCRVRSLPLKNSSTLTPQLDTKGRLNALFTTQPVPHQQTPPPSSSTFNKKSSPS